MTNRIFKRQLAFTRIELFAVIATIVILIVLALSGIRHAKEEALRKQCVQNLKQVGLAFRQWCLDGGDKPPMQITERSGGAQQSIARGEVFRVFQVMSNELNVPKMLVCPADKRTPAPNFAALTANTNVSYFVGLDADDTWPQMFISGDRNLEIDGVAARSGIVALTTNNQLGWTRTIHNRVGNVALADGSVQGFSTAKLREALANTGMATNRLVFP